MIDETAKQPRPSARRRQPDEPKVEVCSFCDKTKAEVAKLVQRQDSDVAICNECVVVSIGIMVTGEPVRYKRPPDPAKVEAAVAQARPEYERAIGWLHGNDTGASSKSIWTVMAGMPIENDHGDIPCDPSDFGRCYRLLQLIPEWEPGWRKAIEARNPAWGPFVEAWDTLVAIYEDELPNDDGKAPRLYAYMQELREP